MRISILLSITFLLLSSFGIQARASDPKATISRIKMGELRYIENKAQWDARVLFKVDLPIGSLFLEKSAFTYVIANKADMNCCHRPEDSASTEHDHMVNAHAFRVNFVGANTEVKPFGEDQFSEYHNYFMGNDPAKWASNVKLYRAVTYPSLYPGVDLHVGKHDFDLKYEFRLSAGADPSVIKLSYEGTNGLEIRDGNLLIRTSVNDILEQKPFAYQLLKGDTLVVDCQYALRGDKLRFVFPGGYRDDLPLVIDPVVVGATYAGSVGSSTYGHSATYDELGNIYMAGRSFGFGYPVTTGSFQTVFGGAQDVGISKMNPTATTLIWATYLGGTNADNAHSLIVNANNELYVYGSTSSANFPVTAGCFDNTLGGGYDIFVSHLSSDGAALIGSTFVGGSGVDGQNAITKYYSDGFRGEIILDTAGQPCVASFTLSNNFPATPSAFDNTYNGQQDGVVFKMNDSLTTMIWATYIGGSGNDAAYGLKLNSINEVYVTGGTNSLDFPIMTWSYKTTYQGGSHDGFICIFSEDVTYMAASTFFGTNSFDELFFIQMNAFNEVYVFGQTEGVIPITPGCYGNPNSPNFIAKLDYSLSEVIFQTTFGKGNLVDNLVPTAFLVDLCDHIYMAGWGQSGRNISGYPLSPDAVQSTTDGVDFYVIALETNATQLMYATYYGAPNSWEHVDGGTSRFDKHGKIYEAVCAGSSTLFPTTPGAYKDYNSVGWDLAVFVIDFELSGPTAIISVDGSTGGCAPFTGSFTNTSLNAIEYLWDFNDGTPMDTAAVPSHTFQNPGIYQVACIAIDSASCFVSDTAFVTITVLAPPVADLGPDTLMCGNVSLLLDAANTGSSYLWSTSATTQQITVSTPGTYWATVNNGQCLDTDSIVVTYMPFPDLGDDTALCTGLSLDLSSGQAGFIHTWSTAETSPSITVTSTGTYWVGISQQSCTLYDTIEVTFIPLPVVELGPLQSICEGDLTTLNAGNPGGSYHWSTGANTQQVQVGQAGMYHVTVTIQGCSSKDSVQVNTMAIPVVNLLGDRHLCEGNTLYLDAGNPGNSYLWSTGDTTQSISLTLPGEYWVRVGYDPCYNYDTITVELISLAVDLGPDTLLCPGGSITLNAGNPGSYFLWNTGDTYQTLKIDRNGTFWVRVYEYECQVSDTVRIDMMEQLVLPSTLNLCGHEYLKLEAGIEADNYYWSTGETSPFITVTEAGTYSLVATMGHCNLEDSSVVIGKSGISTFYVPNSFTPNADGLNETFSAQGVDVTFFTMSIFNRWGELLFETRDMVAGWDGKYKGEYVPGGEYVYVIQYANTCSFDQVFQKKGTVAVLR